MEADLTLPQFPNRTFRAHVTNTAEAVDPTSRSLLTQLQIPNESGELLPGAYAEITFKFTDARFLTIPENTLLFRREGPAVGIVHPDGKVEVRNITINRDDGNKLEVSEGLSISDQVILNPSDDLTGGASVRITEPRLSPGNFNLRNNSSERKPEEGIIEMNQSVNQIETTKVLADPPRPRTKATGVIVFFLVAVGALFLGLAAFGIYTRNQWTGAVQQRTNAAARVLVGVARPEKSTGMIRLQLPGQTMPYTDAAILAQTSGYLKKWYFDIGARVKAGDVLAEIDTPEVDQQLAQAEAQLKLAQAAFDLAEITYKRDQELFKTKVISAQDFDTAADNYAGARSTVVADQAQVGRLQALEDFKTLRAPFDGIVTARNTDIGAYIPAGSGTQLFRMAATSRLRVYVTVPQALSSLIQVGERAELTVDQFPGRKFSALVN